MARRSIIQVLLADLPTATARHRLRTPPGLMAKVGEWAIPILATFQLAMCAVLVVVSVASSA